MKNILCILALFSFSFISCGGDEEPNNPETMELTGKIRGVDFTYGAARFVDFGGDTFTIRVDNSGPEVTEMCDTNSDDVFFSFKPTKDTDRHDLFEDFSTGESIHVTFNHPDFFQNLLITTGYYQLTNISEEMVQVTMDITRNADNFMKGSFVAHKCN